MDIHLPLVIFFRNDIINIYVVIGNLYELVFVIITFIGVFFQTKIFSL